MFSAFLDPQAYSHVAVDIPFLTLYFSLPNLLESLLSFEAKKRISMNALLHKEWQQLFVQLSLNSQHITDIKAIHKRRFFL